LYNEYAAPRDIADQVLAFWTARLPATRAVQAGESVFADGSADLIYRSCARSSDKGKGQLLIVGPMDRPRLLELDEATCFVGVRLSVGSSRLLLDEAPRDLINTETDAAAIGCTFRILTDRLNDARPEDRLATLAAELRDRIATSARLARPRRIRSAVRLLEHGWTVTEVAAELGISVRSLHRDVVHWTGFPPKALARLLRFRRALRRLRNEPSRLLTALAHEAGYADQAHMTREFRMFAGTPPSTLT
jgi:AraC-like DNA-binding protein